MVPIPLHKRSDVSLPYFLSELSAGFPSPADDYAESTLDLNHHLIKHPAATFFVKVRGNSMEGAGIFSGDLLIVDRSLTPQEGSIIVALFRGEFTVKRLRFREKKIILVAEHPEFSPIEIDEESDFQVWGIVTYVIHPCTTP
jgi:DNA polymerase V